LSAILVGCRRGGHTLPYGEGYTFVSQRGDTVRLDSLRGKFVVMTYIYTHCPDACPLTIDNLRKLYAMIPPKFMDTVVFVAITLDPERDTPEVLREYARLQKVEHPNWLFLTGEPNTIKKFIRRMGVIAVKEKPRKLENGKVIYFITHTDYVHIVSPDGRVLFTGDGDHLNVEEALRSLRSNLP